MDQINTSAVVFGLQQSKKRGEGTFLFLSNRSIVRSQHPIFQTNLHVPVSSNHPAGFLRH